MKTLTYLVNAANKIVAKLHALATYNTKLQQAKIAARDKIHAEVVALEAEATKAKEVAENLKKIVEGFLANPTGK